jgi:hypothetical protein
MCGFGELMGLWATGASLEYLGAQGFVLGPVVTLAIYIVEIVSIQQTERIRSANPVHK